MTGWGTVGFDLLKDMKRKISSFKVDKTFLLSLIAGAKEKIGWEKLNYIPSVENAEYYLTGFEKVLNPDFPLGLGRAARAVARQFWPDCEACSRCYRRQRGIKMTANAPLTPKQH